MYICNPLDPNQDGNCDGQMNVLYSISDQSVTDSAFILNGIPPSQGMVSTVLTAQATHQPESCNDFCALPAAV